MPIHTNRLAQETSPYLLQHQHNPVDWYPWGEEAFERAKRENKPIFLSVGYSTCYWCHVMERQCFEVEPIAAVMNELFVCIKVDREERPDVDQLYMTAVQVLTRQGGWPMSVWLTPDRRPFYGGTYFPPADTQGRPGFVRVCKAIDDAWRNRPAEVVESTEQIVSMLQRLARPATPSEQIRIYPQLIGSFIDRSVADYEPRFGGFGHAPKFPRQTVLELLLAYLHSDLDEKTTGGKTPKAKVRQMVLHTLDAMMHGGIRDHLGGGFHRYSTDAKWLVPHFEIMLYDNAMLLTCYAEAHRLTGDARYAQVARDIADFVLREMTSPDGAFYTAMDAEVDHQEGLNYLWKPEEIEAVLGTEEGKRFNRIYGLYLGPNFADPHHGSGVAERNILFIADPGNAADGAASPLLDAELAAQRKKLLASRHTRKQPLLDTKILTSWNALMIRGLAVAGRILAEERYVGAAAKASSFLLSCHRTNDGGLYRTSRDGVLKYRAFLDDYAYLAWAFTDLATASADPRWTAEAQRLLKVTEDRFGDETLGGYFFTDRLADDLFIRQKTSQDSPLPSGNAAAALALTAIQQHDTARRTVAVFSQPMVEHCEAMGSMVQAAMLSMLASGPFNVDVEVVDEENVVLGEDGFSAAPTAAKDVVQLSAVWVSAVELQVRVSIKPGWHINAHNLPAGSGLSSTALHVSPAEGVGNIVYPAGRLYQPDPTLPAVHVYENEATITVQFAADRDQKGIELTLSYQPCNESTCLAPATARLSVARE